MAHILVVDDSALARRTLNRILTEAGHVVVTASEGMEALEKFALADYDLVLLDLTMPGMYGLDVLDQMIALNPDVKVLVATADIQKTTHRLSREGGAAGVLAKPFSPEKVLSAVNQILERGVNEDI